MIPTWPPVVLEVVVRVHNQAPPKLEAASPRWQPVNGVRTSFQKSGIAVCEYPTGAYGACACHANWDHTCGKGHQFDLGVSVAGNAGMFV